MRVTLDRQSLSHALTTVNKAIEARNTIPILGNVLLAVEDGTLRLTGIDLDIEITTTVPVLDATPGALTVAGKTLADIAKRATGDVTMTLEDNRLHVSFGRSRYKLDTLPADDFPSFSAGAFDVTFDIDLAALVAPCEHCMSTESTRYYLNGVYLHAPEGQIVSVATDGHRLVRNVGPAVELPAALQGGVILPRKLIGLLPKGPVTVNLSNSKVRILSGDTVITSKLIDGTFPDYVRVIPQNNSRKWHVDRAALSAAVERVSAISDERGRAVRFDIGANTRLSLGDKAEDELESGIDGDPITIGFNARYVQEMLAALGGEKVRFLLEGGGSPAVLTGEGEWTGVIMPVRV